MLRKHVVGIDVADGIEMKWSVSSLKISVHLFGKQIRLMMLEYVILMPQLLEVIAICGMTILNTQITIK